MIQLVSSKTLNLVIGPLSHPRQSESDMNSSKPKQYLQISAAGHTGAPSSAVAEGRLTKGGTGEVLDRFPGNTAVLALGICTHRNLTRCMSQLKTKKR